MRLFLISIIIAFIGISSLQAQIKTYDIKRIPASEDNPSGIGDLQQISPTRTLALTGGWYGYSFSLH